MDLARRWAITSTQWKLLSISETEKKEHEPSSHQKLLVQPYPFPTRAPVDNYSAIRTEMPEESGTEDGEQLVLLDTNAPLENVYKFLINLNLLR